MKGEKVTIGWVATSGPPGGPRLIRKKEMPNSLPVVTSKLIFATPNRPAIVSGDPTPLERLAGGIADLWIPRPRFSTIRSVATAGSPWDGKLALEGVLGWLGPDALVLAEAIGPQESSPLPGPRQWRRAGQGRDRLGTSRPADVGDRISRRDHRSRLRPPLDPGGWLAGLAVERFHFGP
jgi:hypothetical protein